jgi:hypothetical protein
MNTDFVQQVRQALQTAATIGGLAMFASLVGLGLYFTIMAFWRGRE